MKNLVKTFALVILGIVMASAVNKISAPETRLGYVNVRNLIQQLPEFKTAMTELDSLGKMYERELIFQSEEYNRKLEEFMKRSKEMDTLIRKQREKELETMRASIEEFKANSGQTIRDKEQKLFRPMFDRVKKGVDKVARERGYTHILNEDAASQLLIFGSADTRIDSLVLKGVLVNR
jgi:outer membrane protein